MSDDSPRKGCVNVCWRAGRPRGRPRHERGAALAGGHSAAGGMWSRRGMGGASALFAAV